MEQWQDLVTNVSALFVSQQSMCYSSLVTCVNDFYIHSHLQMHMLYVLPAEGSV